MGVVADEQSHPYTDVSQIKRKGDFSCINFSCGYYNMHTIKEFVVVDDVERSIKFAVESVNTLGLKKYKYGYEKPVWSNYNNSTLFDDFEEYDDEKYDYEDVIEMERLTITTSDDSIIIESKFTGDFIVLDNEEMVELYDIIRTQLITKQTY